MILVRIISIVGSRRSAVQLLNLILKGILRIRQRLLRPLFRGSDRFPGRHGLRVQRLQERCRDHRKPFRLINPQLNGVDAVISQPDGNLDPFRSLRVRGGSDAEHRQLVIHLKACIDFQLSPLDQKGIHVCYVFLQHLLPGGLFHPYDGGRSCPRQKQRRCREQRHQAFYHSSFSPVKFALTSAHLQIRSTQPSIPSVPVSTHRS